MAVPLRATDAAMNKLFAEFLGTFLFCAVSLTAGNRMAEAGALAAMVYALAYVSGAHFNPAVSLAVWMRGQLERNEMFRYFGAQAAGALAAVLVAWVLRHDAGPVVAARYPWFRALLGECCFTFMIAFVYLHVRTARQAAGNTWFGIALGMAHFAGASALAAISGGACNAALGLSHVLSGAVYPGMIFVYALAAAAGGAAAAVAYRLLNPND